ncbi:redoxin family protein [Silvibacterium sp.]|uniref:redoxin family protein n=1 Tax=Silvibacterium sp. TaxID=1964179 RepID=UPI0039E444C0
MRARSLFTWLLLALCSPLPSLAQQAQDDALHLLDKVSKRYAGAKSYHIEAVIERKSSTELSTSWSKTFLRAEEAPGERYRFEGRDAQGSGIIVSDGTTEWNFSRTYGAYTKSSAGTFTPYIHQAVSDDVRVELGAYNLRGDLARTGDFEKSAHFLPKKTISEAGHAIACYVVHYGSEDARATPHPSTAQTTLWIDKQTLAIVRTRIEFDWGAPVDPKHTPLHPIPHHQEILTDYTVTQLDAPIAEDDFTITPPQEASLVETLPSAYKLVTPPQAAAAKPDAKPEDKLGQMEPTTVYRAADGSAFHLSSLLGHPVLVDLWATWCAPCLGALPQLDRIRAATQAAGLAVISIDTDSDPKAGAAFLTRKGYGWKNYHADSPTSTGFPNETIPVYALIDATGRIAYCHSGVNDEAGLLQAIAELGPSYAAAVKSLP